MISRVAVGFHAPRTGLGFLFSLISQSPLKFHISCYEIWHTSGFFFPPSWAPLGFQLTACESQQPFRPASCSASSWKGWSPPHPSLPMVCWGLAVLSIPSALPGCCRAWLPSPAAEAKLSHDTSGHPFCITALLFLPRLIQDDFACGVIHPRGFTGSAWPSATPKRGRREFPSFSPGAGQPQCQRSGLGGRQGAPTTRSAWRYRPRHLQPRLPWGIYLCQICKS